jgi:antitoxin component YwqK of YwqJK toxin-antitoxin module
MFNVNLMLPKPFLIVTISLTLLWKKNQKTANIMKKFILLVAVVFATTSIYAQDCKKSCEGKQDKYVLEDGLINATLFHDNGVIAQTGFYTVSNELTGEWISFDAKGVKTAVAQYDAGKKVGTWLFYQGDDMKEVQYTDTRISEVKTWKITDTRVVSNRP